MPQSGFHAFVDGEWETNFNIEEGKKLSKMTTFERVESLCVDGQEEYLVSVYEDEVHPHDIN
mgnify:CR=1 FL=1